MKNFLIAFTVFLVWSFFGLWLYSWFQADQSNKGQEVELAENNSFGIDKISSEENITKDIEAEEDTILLTDSLPPAEVENNGLELKNSGLRALSDDGDIVFIFEDGISIIKNSNEVFIPESVGDFEQNINSYLLENPQKELHINSLYSASENFESPNLGIKRGESVAQILRSVGIPNNKIVVKSIIKEIEFDTDGSYNNSISFIFKPLDTIRIAELKAKIPETRLLYPKFSTSGLLVNNNLKLFLADIKQLLIDNPDMRIELIGHTDNVGNDIDNYKMGLTYANQVKWYLINKGGIKRSIIKASSKGESEWIEPNNTEKGRIANRRVEVKFYTK